MARFLIDAQLPPALAHLLRDKGHSADHVSDLGLGAAPDRQIWDYALANAAILVTKDEDFADLVSLGREPPTIAWVRVGNTRKLPLLTWFEPLIENVLELAEAGEKLIELR